MKKYHIYRETTEWSTDTPNHIYIFKDSIGNRRSAMCIGYVQAGGDKVYKFKTPYQFDLKDRTFEPLT